MSDIQNGLGETPSVELVVEEDLTSGSRCDEGFLQISRLLLRNRYPDGTESATYRYDLVTRAALDAVVIVLWENRPQGPFVCIRSSLRPPLAFRAPLDGQTLPPRATLWEVPAGLIEADERSPEGRRRTASREAMEEAGCRVGPEEFRELGPAVYLSPGVMAERVHFFAAEVRADCCGAPTEDGSPVEERAAVRFVPLEELLRRCRSGDISDLKTEVAVRRLVERIER